MPMENLQYPTLDASLRRIIEQGSDTPELKRVIICGIETALANAYLQGISYEQNKLHKTLDAALHCGGKVRVVGDDE